MVILGRTEISVVRMLAFTIGSLGLFLLFDWPPLVRTLLIGVLTAAQGLVGALILASLALAPDESDLQARELRLIPLTDVDAISWSRRIAVFGGTLGLAVVTRSLFERLGINADSATAAQYSS